jgi:hypothetical protein
MNYFQKVIIKSNNKLFRATWRQNGEDITIYSSGDEIILYRKFNSYTNDNIELYFETDIDTYNISFQISNTYKFEIKLYKYLGRRTRLITSTYENCLSSVGK